MNIDKIIAVYNTSPLLIVFESEQDNLLELSFEELKSIDGSLCNMVWKQLVEDYQIFECQRTPR